MKRTLLAALCCAAALSGCATTDAAPQGSGPMAFDHFMVAISVADMEKETAWYRDNLGFTVTANTTIGGGTPVRWLENGNERIELIAANGSTAGPVRATPPRHAGIRGISQVTLQTDNLQAARDALVAKGITPALDITEVAPLGIKVIYLVDPEGNAVEIAQKL